MMTRSDELKALSLVLDGATFTAVAKHYGIATSSLWRRLRRLVRDEGWSWAKVRHSQRKAQGCIVERKPRTSRNQERDARIVKARAQGVSVTELARAYGIHRRRVYYILQEAKDASTEDC